MVNYRSGLTHERPGYFEGMQVIRALYQVLGSYEHLWKKVVKNGVLQSATPLLSKWPRYAYHATDKRHIKEFTRGFKAQGLFLTFNPDVASDYAAAFHHEDGVVFQIDLKQLKLKESQIEYDIQGDSGDAFIYDGPIPPGALTVYNKNAEAELPGAYPGRPHDPNEEFTEFRDYFVTDQRKYQGFDFGPPRSPINVAHIPKQPGAYPNHPSIPDANPSFYNDFFVQEPQTYIIPKAESAELIGDPKKWDGKRVYGLWVVDGIFYSVDQSHPYWVREHIPLSSANKARIDPNVELENSFFRAYPNMIRITFDTDKTISVQCNSPSDELDEALLQVLDRRSSIENIVVDFNSPRYSGRWDVVDLIEEGSTRLAKKPGRERL